jgi:hypothetical protein
MGEMFFHHSSSPPLAISHLLSRSLFPSLRQFISSEAGCCWISFPCPPPLRFLDRAASSLPSLLSSKGF